MRHLRSDYDAIQPWPVKRAHHVKLAGELALNVHERAAEANPRVEPLIPDDEPVFLIRGQDPAGSVAVRAYAVAAAAAGADATMVRAIGGWADEMKAYAAGAKHGTPDVPEGILREAAPANPANPSGTPLPRWRAVVADQDGFVMDGDQVELWCSNEGGSEYARHYGDSQPDTLYVVTGEALPVPQSQAPDERFYRMPNPRSIDDTLYDVDLWGEDGDRILAAWRRAVAAVDAMNAAGVQ